MKFLRKNMCVFEVISDAQCQLAECPVWDPVKSELWWTDIPGAAVYRYRFDKAEVETVIQGKMVAGFAMNRAGGLVCACIDGLYLWHPQNGFTLVVDSFAGRDLRFNDATTDAHGRFFAGTRYVPIGQNSGYDLGSLYRIDHDASISVIEEGIHLSNGMDFSPDNRIMYHTDSILRRIYRYDYNIDKGTVANRRVFTEVPPDLGMPDGLTVDSEGYIWSAHWMGSRITRYRPDGGIDRTIECPFSKPTSVVFGGSGLGDLFITSARDKEESLQTAQLSPDEAALQGGGFVFRCRMDVRGKPEHRARIVL
jgi:D-xylonolactonase